MKNLIIIINIFFLNFSIYSEGKNIYNNSLFRINGENVRLREKPSLNSKIVKTLEKGTVFEITLPLKYINETVVINKTNVTGKWIYVKTIDNFQGYIFSYYIGFDLNSKIFPGLAVKKVDKDLLELIGISENNTLQNPSQYFDEKYIKLDKIPKTKIHLLDFNGKKTGELSNIKLSKNGNDCEYQVICLNGQISINQGYNDVLGISDSQHLIFNPIILNKNISRNVKDKIFKNTKERLKQNKQLENEKNWIHHQFMTQSKNLQYIISEYNSSSVRISDQDLHIFRIDIIDGINIKNVHFYSIVGNKADVFKTIALTDLDGDGFPEIWMEINGYEWWYYSIAVIINDIILSVYTGGGGGS